MGKPVTHRLEDDRIARTVPLRSAYKAFSRHCLTFETSMSAGLYTGTLPTTEEVEEKPDNADDYQRISVLSLEPLRDGLGTTGSFTLGRSGDGQCSVASG